MKKFDLSSLLLFSCILFLLILGLLYSITDILDSHEKECYEFYKENNYILNSCKKFNFNKIYE